jgi:hypothetical protein
MLTRRIFAGALLGGAALGAWRSASGSALTTIIDPELGEIPVCQGNVQVADAVGGSSAGLTGERADFDLLEKLGLLEGHLMIGKALLEATMQRDAMPHFGHPVRELYAYIEPQLQQRNVAAYDADLSALEAQARQGASAQFATMYAGVIQKLNATRATVAADRMSSPRFMIGVIAQLTIDVASDYGESQERGRISNTVEYHDAMGFLGYCQALTDRLARSASGRPAQAFQATLMELRGAQRGFPALQPPTRPPITVSTIRGHAARISDLAKDL